MAGGAGTFLLRPTDDVAGIVAAAAAGTVFILAEGEYRNVTLRPKDGQVFIGEGDVVFSGSVAITGWRAVNGVWVAGSFPEPSYSHGEGRNGLAQYVEDLVVDGIPFLRVGSLADLKPGMFFYQNGLVYVSENPAGKVTEVLKTREAVLGGTASAVVVEGIRFEKYASMAQHGAVEAQDTQGWKLIDVEAVGNHGAGVAAGDGMQILGGTYSHNGQVGIHAIDTAGLLIDGVSAVGNNYAEFDPGWDAGGIKILTSTGSVVRNSTISGNNGFGLWFDWDNKDVVVSQNRILDNARAGLFYEASYDALIRDNLIASNNDSGDTGDLWSADLVITSSSNVLVSGNTVISDVGAGIGMMQHARTDGTYGAHQSWNNAVTHNTLVMAVSGQNGFYAETPRGTYGGNVWDFNDYVTKIGTTLYFTWDGGYYWDHDRAQLPIEKGGSFTYLDGLNALIRAAEEKTLVVGPGGRFELGSAGYAAGGDGADFVLGSGGNDVLSGRGGADTLQGGGGNDRLDGGAGRDLMIGGACDDTYIVDDAGDAIVEVAGGGLDEVRSFSSYALPDEVENLVLLRPGLSGTGNALANRITGSVGADTISGLAGNDVLLGQGANDLLLGGAGNDLLLGGTGRDTLSGGAGSDTLDGGEGTDTVDFSAATAGVSVDLGRGDLQFIGADQDRDLLISIEDVVGSAFNDTLKGGAGANLLRGGAGNDLLDGAGGADTMFGGAGDDRYIVDNAGDVVREDSTPGIDDGGRDWVKASISFTLGSFFENLTLTGTGAIEGRGNALGNRLAGNNAANLLVGLEGNDTLIGGLGDDTLLGSLGDDLFYLDGGADLIDGGAGRDTVDLRATTTVNVLLLDGTDERGIARENQGAAAGDKFRSIEVVIGSSTASDVIYGGAEANRLVGDGGDDRLFGKRGSDRLEGGAGADTLVGGADSDILNGGAGADLFVFDQAPLPGSVDTVQDFEVGLDRIALLRGAFGLGKDVSAVALVVGAVPLPTSAGPVLLLDNERAGAGGLFWDADGLGAGKAVQIAQFTNLAVLGSQDFILID